MADFCSISIYKYFFFDWPSKKKKKNGNRIFSKLILRKFLKNDVIESEFFVRTTLRKNRVQKYRFATEMFRAVRQFRDVTYVSVAARRVKRIKNLKNVSVFASLTANPFTTFLLFFARVALCRRRSRIFTAAVRLEAVGRDKSRNRRDKLLTLGRARGAARENKTRLSHTLRRDSRIKRRTRAKTETWTVVRVHLHIGGAYYNIGVPVRVYYSVYIYIMCIGRGE